MAPKTVKSNFRVEVKPRPPGQSQTDEQWERDCDDIARQIRRHVLGIAKHGVSVEWDADRVCEHCSSDWTEDSQTYNGGCCSKDDENAPADEAA